MRLFVLCNRHRFNKDPGSNPGSLLFGIACLPRALTPTLMLPVTVPTSEVRVRLRQPLTLDSRRRLLLLLKLLLLKPWLLKLLLLKPWQARVLSPVPQSGRTGLRHWQPAALTLSPSLSPSLPASLFLPLCSPPSISRSRARAHTLLSCPLQLPPHFLFLLSRMRYGVKENIYLKVWAEEKK